MKIKELAIKDLRPSASLTRKTMDPEGLKELSANILECGLAQPIKVRPMGDGYEIIYGHRRTKASEMAGLKTINAIVDDVDDRTAYLMQLTENEHRENVDQLERAKSWKKLRDKEDLSVVQLANIVGYAEAHVAMTLRGLDGHEAGIRAPTLEQTGMVYSVNCSIEDKKGLANKIVDEQLRRDDLREVLSVYRKRKTPEERKAVIKTKHLKSKGISFDQTVTATLEQGNNKYDRARIYRETNDPVVKEYLKAMQIFTERTKVAFKYRTKFSPEALQFVEGKMGFLSSELVKLKRSVENE
tara:strand:+ start:6703 stop:7599 length:897 start_codon:yes stop_codon:yes gene_type:complete